MQLDDWLEYIQRLHPSEIDLGLQRVRQVWASLGAPKVAPLVVTVAGTNGKGSVVTYVEAILRSAGYRTGAYTSPHVRHFAERVKITGDCVSDASFCAAFERVESARSDQSLSFFEYTTLAALLLFAEAGLDCVILEVGLGGRLDAVNIIDADLAVITSIGRDHEQWLGSDLRGIAKEKAGVVRSGRSVVIADSASAQFLVDPVADKGAEPIIAGLDYQMARQEDGTWSLTTKDQTYTGLPRPALAGDVQYANAAAAIVAVLRSGLLVDRKSIDEGIGTAHLPGRIQCLGTDPELIVDVCHNADSAAVLARWLESQPKRYTRAVFGVMKDKDLSAMVQVLARHVEHWYACSPKLSRSMSQQQLDLRLADLGCTSTSCDSVAAAVNTAISASHIKDRILIIGSFHTVDEALLALEQRDG